MNFKAIGLLLNFFLCVFLVGCGDKPGKGATAERCYVALQPVMQSLERYKAEQRRYPQTLAQLMPQYLNKIPTGEETQTSESQHIVFSYRSIDGNEYVLTFEYVGGGINTCQYHSVKGSWECSGYM